MSTTGTNSAASELYHALDPWKHEIRVLTVLPRGDDAVEAADIQCLLRTVSLDDEPSYKALSYVWGTDLPSDMITIHGEAIAVRKNLATALQQLQQIYEPLHIWVDAICINQTDNKEKSLQVQMMARIYESCSEASVWLGPAENDSDAAMDRPQQIGQQALEAGILELNPEGGQTLELPFHDLARRERRTLFLPGIAALSKRVYWKRVWVLQEFSVPQHVMLYCGSRKIDATTFGAAFTFLGYITTLWLWRGTFDSELNTLARNFSLSNGPLQLFKIRQRTESLRAGRGLSLIACLQLTHITSPSFLIVLNATNSRDCIYGLLALAADAEKLAIVPNYDIPTAEVYRNTA